MVPWTEIGIFWVSLILAVITVTATVINYLFFRSQIDPEVLVYATLDERRPSIINLIIENIGNGLAKDVKFATSQPIPQKAFGITDDAKTPKDMDHGPLINGIPALGPGSKRVITWGQYGGLKKGLGDSVIDITVQYKSNGILGIIGRDHSVVCPVDIRSFEGTNVADNNWDKKSAEHLGNIAKTLDWITTGFKTLKIDIQNVAQSEDDL